MSRRKTAGKEWAQTREKEVEDQLVYENKDVRVFDTNGIFCAASYFSPNQNTICPATITYNEKFKSITLAFEDGGKQFNAREIVQELWDRKQVAEKALLAHLEMLR